MIGSNRLIFGLLATASALAIVPAAQAQQAASDDAASFETIVVTGSRVIQNGNNMPTPVTVVSTEQLLTTTPTNIQDGLAELPIFSGGQGGQGRQSGNSSGNGSAHAINLRNMGATRTLVLFDGRRLAPTTTGGVVNADIAPSLLLQRVDIVTGGASAVYGSDAVAGVVNFVIDDNFNGLKMNAQAGITQRGDGANQRFGIAAGTPLFDGRGHIEASYEFFNSPGIDSKLVRDWGRKVWTVQGKGTAAMPYRLLENTRLSSTSWGGNIKSGIFNDMTFDAGGVLRPYVHGKPVLGTDGVTAIPGVEDGGDGAYYSLSSLQSRLRTHQAFGRFDYDLTDDVRFYVEGAFVYANNRSNHQNNEIPRSTKMSVDNAFLAPEYRDAMIANGETTFTFTKMFDNWPVLQPESYVHQYLAITGLRGSLGKFQWDASYLFQDNRQKTSNNHNLDNQKLFAALDAVRDPSGKIVCNVTLTNPNLYPGCVPLNPFGPNSETQEMIDYVVTKTTFEAHTRMHNVGLSIAGSPFATWAGDAQFALSGEWRRLEYDLVSNAQPDPADCTGLRYNCTASTLKFISNVQGNRTPVSQSVKEAAIEADLPLLLDAPLAQSFNVNGAFRYTDYDTSGHVNTWKVGIDWHLNDSISFRGTRSRDIRAPNLSNLFAPTLINPAGTSDLHTGVVGQAPFITQSNPNLDPEIAYTWTAGVVLRPEFIPNLSLSVDWYKISINNAITNISGSNTAIMQICEDSRGTSPYCALIVRPGPWEDFSPANTATAYLAQPENAQVVKTDGVDFELNYATDLGNGRLTFRKLVSYQPHLTTINFPGAPATEAADTPEQAKWRGIAFLNYSIGNFAVSVQERWHSSTDWNSNHKLVYAEPRLPWAFYTNMTLTANVDAFQYFLTISNLFDRQPTPYGNIGGSSGVPGLFGGYIQGDDHLGRAFTIGARLRM